MINQSTLHKSIYLIAIDVNYILQALLKFNTSGIHSNTEKIINIILAIKPVFTGQRFFYRISRILI